MTPVLIAAVVAIVVVPILLTVILKFLYKVPAADQALIITGARHEGADGRDRGPHVQDRHRRRCARRSRWCRRRSTSR